MFFKICMAFVAEIRKNPGFFLISVKIGMQILIFTHLTLKNHFVIVFFEEILGPTSSLEGSFYA